jgi:hypothetical protein
MPNVEEELVNFYGVIVDASMPMKTATQKFVTTLKLVDASMHSLGNEPNVNFEHATAIIYAKRIEDCPLINCIGDIIRIHRANYKEWKGKPQFNVNVQFNSSWCLFSTSAASRNSIDDDVEMQDNEIPTHTSYVPYKFSGKSYSQDLSVEKPLLDGLRRWAVNYFANNSVVHKSNYTPLKDVSKMALEENKEVDLLVKVLKCVDKDEQSLELRIKDISQELWFMTLPRVKFNGLLSIKEGEILRVRSVMKDNTSKRNTIVAKNLTNVLRFMPGMQIVKDLQKLIQD